MKWHNVLRDGYPEPDVAVLAAVNGYVLIGAFRRSLDRWQDCIDPYRTLAPGEMQITHWMLWTDIEGPDQGESR